MSITRRKFLSRCMNKCLEKYWCLTSVTSKGSKNCARRALVRVEKSHVCNFFSISSRYKSTKKMTAASWRFRSVHEEDLDKVLND